MTGKNTRSAKPCTHPGCRVLVRDGKSKCPNHWQDWTKREGTDDRMRGRALQDARARLFRRSPLCAECVKADRVALATQRDHVVPLAEGGTDTDDNVQGLCTPCHDAKSEAERKRGIQRN